MSIKRHNFVLSSHRDKDSKAIQISSKNVDSVQMNSRFTNDETQQSEGEGMIVKILRRRNRDISESSDDSSSAEIPIVSSFEEFREVEVREYISPLTEISQNLPLKPND